MAGKQLSLKLLDEKIDRNYNNLKNAFYEVKKEKNRDSNELFEIVNEIKKSVINIKNQIGVITGEEKPKIFEVECIVKEYKSAHKKYKSTYKEYKPAYPERHWQNWNDDEKESLYKDIMTFCEIRAEIHKRTSKAIGFKIRDYIKNVIEELED